MTASRPTTPAELLVRAASTDPARPLLTFYDDATGERTELSVVTFANWVAKTANLVRDDLDLQPGARMTLRLPVHWQAAVWLQAAWSAGLVVDLDNEGTELAVVSHDVAAAQGDAVVSCGLGPMGLPRPGVVPANAGALDYDREVHAHGDRFGPAASLPNAPALIAGGRTLTHRDLVAAAERAPLLPDSGRLLVADPLDTIDAVLGGLVVPLLTGAGAVLCRHLDPFTLAARVEQENLAAALGGPRAELPGWSPAGWGNPRMA